MKPESVKERFEYFSQYTLSSQEVCTMVLADILNEINQKFEFIVEKIKNDECNTEKR